MFNDDDEEIEMTYTAQQLGLDPAIIQPGRYYRFDAFGRRFLGSTDYLSNGLGLIYRANRDGTLSRYHF